MMSYVIYGLIFVTLLSIDFLATRGGHVSIRRALTLCGIYLTCALGFAGYIGFTQGSGPAVQFTTIYFLEQILSVDNLLVITLIFGYFGIPEERRHAALLWGIGGAIVARIGFIVGGAALISRFEWLLYVFGAFLIFTGGKIGLQKSQGDDEEGDVPGLVQIISRHSGKCGTFVAAIFAIELSDIMFAVDSIPASFSVSRDPFIVLSANLFAVLGLRSLYHAVEYGLSLFHGLERFIGLALVFLGLEVFIKPFIHIPSWATMVITFGIIGYGIVYIKLKGDEKCPSTV